jgi:hypothetical protein
MTLTPGRIEVMARELAARSDRDVAEAIKRYDAQDKIALKHAVQMAREAQGITLDGAAEVPGRRIGEQDGAYWLRRLNVHGPIDLKTLEAKMTAAGLKPELRIEIKCEAIERKWLAPSLGYRVTAAGELATDQDGRPLGRMASDDAAINYGPPPLSLEMAGLFTRAGLREDRSYSQQEVDETLWTSDLSPMQKMACRQELHMRRQLRASGLDTLHERLAALRQRQHRQSSMQGRGVHTIQASAAVEPQSNKILRDLRTGEPVTLTFLP